MADSDLLLETLMKEVSQIRRPFHARSLVLVSQCRLLKGRVALQGNPSSERALINRKALKAAGEAVPSNSSFLRLQTRAITEARIFDNVFELISKFLGTYGVCGFILSALLDQYSLSANRADYG
ncbi:hypothetical protein FRC02_011476 [Tulasnella sp. 418]|nr:hypothetical protein FRC02_011476 [Tulasnella sp. 418]